MRAAQIAREYLDDDLNAVVSVLLMRSMVGMIVARLGCYEKKKGLHLCKCHHLISVLQGSRIQ